MARVKRIASAVLAVALAPVLGLIPIGRAASGDSLRMVDVDTPTYLGFDPTLKADHFRVTGRWLSTCGGRFCWGSTTGSERPLGSADAVEIRFSDAVQFVRFRIRTFGACAQPTSDRAGVLASGSFRTASADVADVVSSGWTYATDGGAVVSDSGSCRLSTMPRWDACGGSACVATWADMAARSFVYDVWVNPAPSRGSCYDSLSVRGSYRHTSERGGHVDAAQDRDGHPDPELTTPRLCRH